MRIKVEVKLREWGIEVWHTIFDDKGKKISERQQGAAVCGPDTIDIERMMALMDPFKVERT